MEGGGGGLGGGGQGDSVVRILPFACTFLNFFRCILTIVVFAVNLLTRIKSTSFVGVCRTFQ